MRELHTKPATTKNGISSLLFTKYADRYFLTNLSAPNYGAKISKPKEKWKGDRKFIENANSEKSITEIVAIALNE